MLGLMPAGTPANLSRLAKPFGRTALRDYPADRVYPTRPLMVVVLTMLVVAAAASFWRVRHVEQPAELVAGAAWIAFRQWALPMTFVAVALLIAAKSAVRWQRPVRRLRRATAACVAGRGPIEEIEAGPLASPFLHSMAGDVRRLAADLKASRARVRELEAEMKHKLADRETTMERRLDAVKHKATRDPLSGLGNRAGFDEAFAPMVDAARSKAAELCVVMIDLDHFKQVNDQLGHDAGDRFIREVGRILKGAVREGDGAYRYGGDEFVLLLAGTTPAAGKATAERLSRLVGDMARPLDIEPRPGMSFGLASLSANPTADAEVLLKAADQDCYRRKIARKAGTDRRAA